MVAHEERAESKAKGQGAAARQVRGVAGRGPEDQARLLDLAGLVGNRVVARLVAQRRHAHGPACGHGEVEDTSPAGQSDLLHRALAESPGRPLPPVLEKEASAFYGRDMSPTRLHDGPVAQRATAAMGAEAMTVGHHVFLPPEAARKKHVVGHELSHVKENLHGVRETGTDNGAGVTITDPGQGSERSADTDGAAFAAGAGTAPSVAVRRAVAAGSEGAGEGGRGAVQRSPLGTTGTGHGSSCCAGHHVQRMPKKDSQSSAKNAKNAKGDGGDKSRAKDKGKGRATAASASASGRGTWEESVARISELANKCTCAQVYGRRAGRTPAQAILHYARSYKQQPDEQSLRHLSRVLFQELQAGGQEEEAHTPRPAEAKEKELQSMLANDHLLFATNLNASVARLHSALLAESPLVEGRPPVEDAHGDSLRRLLLTGHGHAESESEEDPEPAPGSAKRPAPDRRPGQKRRKTGERAGEKAGEKAGGAAGEGAGTYTSGRAAKRDEEARRDEQARRKIRQGFTPQPMPQVPPHEAMDVDADGRDGTAGGPAYKRDNRTLQALRNTSYVRMVDVSRARTKDEDYRAYLAKLIAPDGEYANYAYLLHDGTNKDDVHAEQKHLSLLANAGLDREAPPQDPVLIRGRKRPCQGCLKLLEYVRDELGIDLRFNPNGNNFYEGPLRTAVKNFRTGDAEQAQRLEDHLAEGLGAIGHSHVSAPRHAQHAPAGPGVGEVEADGRGGFQQPFTLRKVMKEGTDEVAYVEQPNGGEMQTVDSPSTSEASGDSDAELASRTRRMRLADASGRLSLTARPPGAPQPVLTGAEKKERADAEFERVIVPLLLAKMHDDLKAERVNRAAEAPYRETFPQPLLQTIKDLTVGDGARTTKTAVASWFGISKSALQVSHLAKLGQADERKQAKGADAQGAREIEREMTERDPHFHTEWQAVPQGGKTSTKFSKEFAHYLWSIMYERPANRVSYTWLADFLKVERSTMNNRAGKMRKDWGDPREGGGRGRSSR
ncbi:DUF4157 domain-containing protein [Streptomyces sp. NBC_00536]|uniref:eCIS core domain-containing protein n=1 Tax=Streptomyces sp. NBC_00536 TaxID=2975769 RepID=UPI002E81D8F3|nr:DUF4157 domain-containing protein [Streptomyces sp. NBC_00536]WUC83226.1 DUF4157 domain-containing protein [Streptomyces sp. NBC_00536]